MTIDGELRRAILEALVECPLTTNELAARFDVMRGIVWDVCKRLEEQGRLEGFRAPGVARSVLWSIRRDGART